ncbi:MAG: 1-phosphofructokinase family hexose kinase [Candidatus Omnitrophota bacterium]
MIGTITLNPSIDQHLIVPHLHMDDTNRARSITDYPGGKGLNVSKVVRELGGPTRAYALVAGFVGRYWGEGVRKLDIPFSAVFVKGETRINTILTDLKDRTQTRVSAPGPRVAQNEINAFLKKLLSVRPRPFLWALGGSLSRGMKPSTYGTFIGALQRSGTPCILDTDNESLKLGIEAKPFMIKPNEYEMERLVGRRFRGVKDYAEAARTLVRKGIRVVVVSLGKKGALFVTDTRTLHVLTPSVPVRSKVGAGDSLIAGFALGLLRNMNLEEAARLGVAASTSAVMREAPRLCLRSDIQKLLPRVAIRTL